ncbi:MAG TPA: GNAT family N-acetyltransferase [Allosphingosinicella sp.]
MSLRLVPLQPAADIARLTDELVPSFGGDEAAAREMLTATFGLLTADPRPDPWGCYLAYDGETPVGTCAFKTAPDAVGTVELAYMTFPAHEGRGHATAMARELERIAFAAGASLPIAHTLPLENASNRALRRNGFVFAGEVIDPEDGLVWRWEKKP